ncbi:MAG: GNAT family N-acetyltransferase [Abditibacteriales bacterium]|nr:GNAT family N-acetyltransferase [Abditibacteriales bacterium]MDW8365240.1 GNAT family N-acetyltransferase [Abditibacteriales bacterium]
MMKLTYETLDVNGIREAAAQTHSFWGGERTLEEHTQRTFDALAWLGRDLRYVGLRDERGALLASLKCYAVALQTPRGIARTLGIGAVFVPETERGKGYGQAVVQAAMDEARALGFDAALLYSDIPPRFYARLGFVEFPALDWSAQVTALPDSVPLRTRTTTADDFDTLSAWYHADAVAADIFPVRSSTRWRFGKWFNGAGDELILNDGERDVGYVNLRSTPQGLRVFEWAAPGVEPERVWATMRRLAEMEGQPHVCGWLRFDRRETWMAVTPRPNAIPMVAPLKDTLAVTANMKAFFGEMDHF